MGDSDGKSEVLNNCSSFEKLLQHIGNQYKTLLNKNILNRFSENTQNQDSFGKQYFAFAKHTQTSSKLCQRLILVFCQYLYFKFCFKKYIAFFSVHIIANVSRNFYAKNTHKSDFNNKTPSTAPIYNNIFAQVRYVPIDLYYVFAALFFFFMGTHERALDKRPFCLRIIKKALHAQQVYQRF